MTSVYCVSAVQSDTLIPSFQSVYHHQTSTLISSKSVLTLASEEQLSKVWLVILQVICLCSQNTSRHNVLTTAVTPMISNSYKHSSLLGCFTACACCRLAQVSRENLTDWCSGILIDQSNGHKLQQDINTRGPVLQTKQSGGQSLYGCKATRFWLTDWKCIHSTKTFVTWHI